MQAKAMSGINSICCGGGGRAGSVGGTVRNVLFHSMRNLWELFGGLKKTFLFASPESRHEVVIMYFDRTSEFLMVTSERMAIPDGPCTLEKVLNRLRERGARWAYELDGSHVLCAVNGNAAFSFDMIEAGAEISISSRKSIFEP